MDKRTDSQLIADYRNGDLGAFTVLFNRHYTNTRNKLSKLESRSDLLEDLCQETWIRVNKSILNGNYHDENKFSSYVHLIAQNMFINEYRKRTKMKKHATTLGSFSLDTLALDDGSETFADNIVDESLNVQDRIVKMESELDWSELLDLLNNTKMRQVVQVRLDGFQYEDIAEAVGIPIGTVRSILHRAKPIIKKAIEEEKGKYLKSFKVLKC